MRTKEDVCIKPEIVWFTWFTERRSGSFDGARLPPERCG